MVASISTLLLILASHSAAASQHSVWGWTWGWKWGSGWGWTWNNVCGMMGPSEGALISKYNEVMLAWEQGEEVKYKNLVSDSINMKIAMFGVDLTGKDGIWGFRGTVATQFANVSANAPLTWINTHDTFIVDTEARAVQAYMKSFSILDGSLVQLGRWNVTFDADLKCATMDQKVLWRPAS
jgi:hypothetical protein